MTRDNQFTLKRLSSLDEKDCFDVFKAAYHNMDVPESEEGLFQNEFCHSMKQDTIYKVHFFGYMFENSIVSFAGIAQSLFMMNSWELRWDTTHPDFQGRGLMSRLIDDRLDFAKEETLNMPGVIHVCSRRPSIYLHKGFEPVFERGPQNASTYCVKKFNMEHDKLGNDLNLHL